MSTISTILNLELDGLVRKAVHESIQETFAELLEDERTEQQHVSDQLKGMRAQTEVDDVEEADEDESSDEEKAVKVAKKKKEVEVDVEETADAQIWRKRNTFLVAELPTMELGDHMPSTQKSTLRNWEHYSVCSLYQRGW